MTVQEWQAGAIEINAKILAHWVDTTEPDKLQWRPAMADGNTGRSVLDITAECADVCRRAAAALRGEQPSPPAPNEGNGVPFGGDSKEAQKQLAESAAELADAVRAMSESDLGRAYQMPYGPWTGAFIIGVAANHLAYHGGQVCYIQTLYGDKQFRVPPMPGMG